MARLTQETFGNLQEFAHSLALGIKDAEYGGSATVNVEGVLPHVHRVLGWKPEKDKLSLDHFKIDATVTVEDNSIRHSASVAFNHITACPCVQQTFKHALAQTKPDEAAALAESIPFLTHSQRCHTKVTLQDIAGPFPFEKVVEVIDSVVHRVQNTLPREYELDLVHRAHKRPQFAEDVIRELAVAVGKEFCTTMPDSQLRLETRSFESIHDYDLVANLDLPMSYFSEI